MAGLTGRTWHGAGTRGGGEATTGEQDFRYKRRSGPLYRGSRDGRALVAGATACTAPYCVWERMFTRFWCGGPRRRAVRRARAHSATQAISPATKCEQHLEDAEGLNGEITANKFCHLRRPCPVPGARSSFDSHMVPKPVGTPATNIHRCRNGSDLSGESLYLGRITGRCRT